MEDHGASNLAVLVMINEMLRHRENFCHGNRYYNGMQKGPREPQDDRRAIDWVVVTCSYG